MSSWIERLEDYEVEQMKLIYVAVYDALGLISKTPCEELEASSVYRRHAYSVKTSRSSTRSSQLSIMSGGTGDNPEFKPPPLWSSNYVIAYSKRFPPVSKMVRAMKKKFKNHDRAVLLEKFRYLTRDNSDKLIIRFIRHCHDSMKAVTQLAKAIVWHVEQCNVEKIMMEGEWGLIKKEGNHLPEYEHGRWAVVGKDKVGRPLCVCRPKHHRAHAHSKEQAVRGMVKILEELILFTNDEVDGFCVIFDYGGLRFDNVDIWVMKTAVSLVNELYPNLLGCSLVHNAPKFYQSIFRFIRPVMDPSVAQKIKFCRRSSELLTVVNIDQLPKYLGGFSRHEYKWISPVMEDDAPLQDQAKRKELQKTRLELLKEFEQTTVQWIKAVVPAATAEFGEKRDHLLEQIRENYWQLDPYVRSRSVFDRNGIAGYLRPELQAGGIAQPCCQIRDPFPPTNTAQQRM